jgi:hypothetical protein
VIRQSPSNDLCILGKVNQVESDCISFIRLYPSHDKGSTLLAKRPQFASWSARSNAAIHKIRRDDPRLTLGLKLEITSDKLTSKSVEILFRTGLQYEIRGQSPKTLFSNESIRDLYLEGVRVSAHRVYFTFRDKLSKVRKKKKKKTYRI